MDDEIQLSTCDKRELGEIFQCLAFAVADAFLSLYSFIINILHKDSFFYSCTAVG